MNIKLILTTALVALVTFGLQAQVVRDGFDGGLRRPVARPVTTTVAKPVAAKPVTQAKAAAVAPRTTTDIQNRAAVRGGKANQAFF